MVYFVSVGFWLVAAAAAIELWEIRQDSARNGASWGYADRGRALSMDACAAVVDKYARAYGASRLALPKRDTFPSLNAEGRQAWAVQRQESVLVCNRQGFIDHCYLCEPERPMGILGRSARPGDSIRTLFEHFKAAPPVTGNGLWTTAGIRTSTYQLSSPEGTQQMIECASLVPEDPQKQEVFVFLARSPWDTYAQRYSKNITLVEYTMAPDRDEFRTNNLGWRDSEIALPKAAGVVRLVCVGGSTTVEGRTNEATYPKMLQVLLRERFHTDRIEVINCGVDGTCQAMETANLPDYLALQPDLVVYYNAINDLRMTTLDWCSKRDTLWSNLLWHLRRSHALFPRYARFLIPSCDQMCEKTVHALLASLHEFSGKISAAGVKVALCSFARPDVEHLDAQGYAFFERKSDDFWFDLRVMSLALYRTLNDRYNRALAEMCEHDHVLYVPVAEGLKAGIECFTDLCHLNPVGIEKKATIIAESLHDTVAVLLAANEQAAKP